MKVSYFCLFMLLLPGSLCAQRTMRCDSARIEFVSEAPLELISAISNECVGVLDLEKNEYAFRVKIRSFHGFNSPLQREHFNENYLESESNPLATFRGRFIETLSINTPGQVMLKVKGDLDIHGVSDERVLEVLIQVREDGTFSFHSRFDVELESHAIQVPRIVYQKISEVIDVEVNGIFR